MSFLFSVTFFTLFCPIPCTHISLRKWRKKCAFGIDKNEWPDETSQKGCDLSLNHLTLFMANVRVSVHDVIHTHTCSPIKICSKLIRYGNLFCVVCDTCSLGFCSLFVWKYITWAHKINEPIYYTFHIFSGSILMCYAVHNNRFWKSYQSKSVTLIEMQRFESLRADPKPDSSENGLEKPLKKTHFNWRLVQPILKIDIISSMTHCLVFGLRATAYEPQPSLIFRCNSSDGWK